MAGEIFISYRRADEPHARLLYNRLKEHGVEAWYDAHVGAGEDWRTSTARALQNARIFVLLFSRAAAASDDITKELAAATFSKKLIVPVRIEDIQPEGAFLYELAGRNWINAYEETDAKIGELARSLAALVKSGKEDPAMLPFDRSVGGGAKAKPKKARSPLLWLAGAAVAVLAAAAIAVFALSPRSPQLVAERTAFFGFAPDGGDITAQVAAAATEETRTTLNTLSLETAAPGDTQGVKPEDQMERARQLNARYALGGAVLANGDQLTVTIRLDDTQLRATLWQTTLTGAAAQRESLPVLAAARATNMMRCLIAVRPGMTREDAATLAVVTRACGILDDFDPEYLPAWIAAARIAPKSIFAQMNAGAAYINQSPLASAADRPAMLDKAREAYRRAQAIEPDDGRPKAGLAFVDVASDRPLAQIIEDLNAGLRMDADRSRRQSVGVTAAVRMAFLTAVGRGSEAVRLGRADLAADPLSPLLQRVYAVALNMAGQRREAQRMYELVNQRLADPLNWTALAQFTVHNSDDLAPVVVAAPPGVSLETIACWQDLDRALRASAAAEKAVGVRRMQACLRAGSVQPAAVITSAAALGDKDSAFAIVDQAMDRSNPVAFIVTGTWLFHDLTRPLRDDPRFLPLVRKLGIYQYWIDTGTQPDVCDTPEERDFEVCTTLREAQ